MQLSKRLRTIIDMALPADTAADIGTDHGFVPIALLQEGTVKRCIAADINAGPLARAKEHAAEAGLTDRCSFRLGAGLDVLEQDEAELVIIAGMGGMLIREILRSGADKLGTAQQLLLSPHTEVRAVREAVEELGFRIAREAMVHEEGKFYTVISAVPGSGARMTEEELKYGPRILKERPEAFLEYLRFRIRREEEIIEKIRQQEKEGTASVSPAREESLRAHEEELRELVRILSAGG